jgi:molecular chaperone DnaJ
LPAFGGDHGDLYLRIGVRVQEHLTREERGLYERLRAIVGKAR